MKLPNTKIFVLSTLLLVAFFASLIFIFFKQPSTINGSIFWIQHTQEVLYKSEKVFSLVTNYDKDMMALQLTNSSFLTIESAIGSGTIIVASGVLKEKQLQTENMQNV